MDYDFHSQADLYKRVRPALQIEEEELHRYGYSFVKKVDIWNYWIEKKWKHITTLSVCVCVCVCVDLCHSFHKLYL